MVSWEVGVSILLGLCEVLTASRMSCDFIREPHSIAVPEGATYTFYCQHDWATIMEWSVNGTLVTDYNFPNITQGSVKDANGTEVSTLTVGALREYNQTVVQCQAFTPDQPCYVNATYFIKDPPRPVANLDLRSTTREIVITWDQPNLDDSHCVCVDVYRVSNLEPEHVGGQCYVNISTYTFNVSDPNAEVQYNFVVTTQHCVTGAKNGTQSNITGYFAGGTHFIQTISVQPCNTTQKCQLRVSLTYVVDGEVATGALVVLHDGHNDLQYFVGSRGEDSTSAVLVNGLKGDNYSLAVFSLGGNGLPSELPANLPIVVDSIPPAVNYEDLRVEHLKDVNLESNGACFTCHFHAHSPATHCAIIVLTLPQSPAEQIKTKSYIFQRDHDNAFDCIDIKLGQDYVSVAFGYLNRTLSGLPLSIGLKPGGETTVGLTILVVIVGTCAIILALAAAVLFVLVVVYRVKQATPKRENEQLDPSRQSECIDGQNLAEEKYLFHTLPKAIESADSGIYTKSTSDSVVEENTDMVHHVVTDEGAKFNDATQCERGCGDGELSVKREEDDDQTCQRAVHLQETEQGNHLNYAKMILPTLTSGKDAPTTVNVPTHDNLDDSITGDGDANTSFVKLFKHDFSH